MASPQTSEFQSGPLAFTARSVSTDYVFTQSAQGTATGGSTTTLVDTGEFDADTVLGNLYVNETDNAFGILQALVTSATVTFAEALFALDGSAGDFAAADTYFFIDGPRPILQQGGGGEMVIQITDCIVAKNYELLLSMSQTSIVTGFPIYFETTTDKTQAAHVEVHPETVATGKATAAATSGVLTDTNADFNNIGLAAGDVIYNVTDGSWSRVASWSDHTLKAYPVFPTGTHTSTVLSHYRDGTNNDWTVDDAYVITRGNMWINPAMIQAAIAATEYPFTVTVTELG